MDRLVCDLHKHYTKEDTSKLEGNIFYGKMIEDLERYINKSEESIVDIALRTRRNSWCLFMRYGNVSIRSK